MERGNGKGEEEEGEGRMRWRGEDEDYLDLLPCVKFSTYITSVCELLHALCIDAMDRMVTCCLGFLVHTRGAVHCSRTFLKPAHWTMTRCGIILQLFAHCLTTTCLIRQSTTTLILVSMI